MNAIFHHGQTVPPILLLHGGAGSLPDPSTQKLRQEELSVIGQTVLAQLDQGLSAIKAVSLAVEKLEDCPLFNAGRGAALQSDGLARLSASLMDGQRQKFSGVLLATHLIHPSRLAVYLQHREESVVGPLGAQLIARELGIPPELPLTSESIERWTKALTERRVLASEQKNGTVGAVALDINGNLAAATSTGGGRANFPERVSDSATVAGNYASGYAAFSCTGIGERIVDDGLAVRLETRVRDGADLISASQKTLEEAVTRQRRYGWIGIDYAGHWVVACTTEAISWWGSF
ncbi:MAG: isoaspartyl peptidase/L-asparaginase [Methylohalobius sp.]|nr:isoaspartyl peptidase/L-asparaginase [Methylohalobius sp.]